MCDKATSSSSNDIVELLQHYQFDGWEAKNYGYHNAFVLGYKMITVNGETMPLFVVIARGSITYGEFLGDWWKGFGVSFLDHEIYQNVYDYEEEIWNEINKVVEKDSVLLNATKMKVLVTGYSLGGAAANAVAARFNYGIAHNDWWASKMKKQNVYAYTFGAIKTLTGSENVSKGYENIHNIYNYYDSFGPNGNWVIEASSPYAKFGHTEIYDTLRDEEEGASANNHSISGNYMKAVEGGLVSCDNKYNLSFATVTSVKDRTYSGKPLKQSPAVTLNGQSLKAGRDYQISYKNNKQVGKATITIKGKGKYFGSIKTTFKVLPRKTSIRRLTPGRENLEVRWNKGVDRISGYELQCSSDPTFKEDTKVITIKSARTVSKVISGLKPNSTYYVRIRTYKTIGEDKFASRWSASRNVRTKYVYYLPETVELRGDWGKYCGVDLAYNTKADVTSVDAYHGEYDTVWRIWKTENTLHYRKNGKLRNAESKRANYTYRSYYNGKGHITRAKGSFGRINYKYNKKGYVSNGFDWYDPELKRSYSYTYYNKNKIKTITTKTKWAGKTLSSQTESFNKNGLLKKTRKSSPGSDPVFISFEYQNDEANRVIRIDVEERGDGRTVNAGYYTLSYGSETTTNYSKYRAVMYAILTEAGCPSMQPPYLETPLIAPLTELL